MPDTFAQGTVEREGGAGSAWLAGLPATVAESGIFAEAAELDGERVRRWAQFQAVQSSFWGRRHGFRAARGRPRLDQITEFADRLAEILTDPPC